MTTYRPLDMMLTPQETRLITSIFTALKDVADKLGGLDSRLGYPFELAHTAEEMLGAINEYANELSSLLANIDPATIAKVKAAAESPLVKMLMSKLLP